MRKIVLPLILVLCLSGCATYKFQKGPVPYNNGYVVFYDGRPLPEYTLGPGNSVPELPLAKERFKRRRAVVEYYYKKMGEIESRFKKMFWDPPAMCVDFIWGTLRWPVTAINDYKYNHDPAYKDMVDRIDEQKDELEKTQVNNLKTRLKSYIDEDLAGESAQAASVPAEEITEPADLVQHPVIPETRPEAASPAKEELVKAELDKIETKSIPEPAAVPASVPAPVVSAPVVSAPAVVTPEVFPVENKNQAALVEEPSGNAYPVAVIVAKPVKGFSPLQVNFNGGKSYSESGRIVSYSWDFGDGDNSTKKNPTNTYWSTTYGVRSFVATLTVKDEKGKTASSSTTIEVLTK